MSKKNKLTPTKNRNSKRVHRHVFMLNDMEQKALERYIEKYKITSKSKLFREVLMMEVIRRLEEDSPTLFDD